MRYGYTDVDTAVGGVRNVVNGLMQCCQDLVNLNTQLHAGSGFSGSGASGHDTITATYNSQLNEFIAKVTNVGSTTGLVAGTGGSMNTMDNNIGNSFQSIGVTSV